MRHPLGPTVVEHTGERAVLRPLFELAEDSPSALDAYIGTGRVLVAVGDGVIRGHLQLTETGDPAVVEIKNMAVVETHRGRGIGRSSGTPSPSRPDIRPTCMWTGSPCATACGWTARSPAPRRDPHQRIIARASAPGASSGTAWLTPATTTTRAHGICACSFRVISR